MATGQSRPEADLLHPLATLHLEHCHKPRWNKKYVGPTHCVVLHDRVVILTGSGFKGPDVVHISSTDLNSWSSSTLPYGRMSLTTYQSKFVAVGGWHPATHEPSNELFTSDVGMQWQATLPPMPTKRFDTSAVSTRSPEVLVVAGGMGSGAWSLDVVEVLQVDHWTTVDSLPAPCYRMHSIFHDGNLYFIRGVYQKGIVYTCSCSSLISSTKSTTAGRPLWSQFVAPGIYPAAVSYSSYLVSIDGQCVIRAYSSETQSWLEATRTGEWSYKDTGCMAAAVLPTGEIVYAHIYGGVYRLKLLVLSFDPDSRFISNVHSRLEAVMGIHIVSVLANICQQLTTSSGVELQPRRKQTRQNKYEDEDEILFLDSHNEDEDEDEIPLPHPHTEPVRYVEEVILQWSAGRSHRPPTWRQLLDVLRDIGLSELSQQINTFMKGGAAEDPATDKQPSSASVSKSNTSAQVSEMEVAFSNKFTAAEIADWMAKNYQLSDDACKIITNEGITGYVFTTLKDDDIKELGFNFGARRTLTSVLKEIQSQPKPTSHEPAAQTQDMSSGSRTAWR